MAHFAEIDNNNIVKRVLVVHNSIEHRGEEFLSKDLGLGGRWIQTSYNSNFRKQYAGVGYYYDELNDVFISPKPYTSWVLDDNFNWSPPIPMPTDGVWIWDENIINWIEVK